MGITRFSETYLSSLPIGSEIPWPDASAIPAGFFKLDGSAISRTAYATLYGQYGTAWGTGNGSTTFNLPNVSVDTLPWNLPRGRVAYASVTSNQTGIGTGGADLTGLTVTFTAQANRRYRVSGQVRPFNTSTATTVFLHIRNGSSVDQMVTGKSMVAGSQDTMNTQVVLTPGAGSVTYKLYAVTAAGTTDFAGGSTTPAHILVEDIGADTTASPWSTGCWIVKAADVQPTLVGAPYQICTSSTNPAGSAGKMIYETDTKDLLVHDGSDYYKPWNMAWGQVALATITGNQGSITSLTDVTGLSATWTAVANRRYKISLHVDISSTAADGVTVIYITDSSNNIIARTTHAIASTASVTKNVFITVSPSAGSVTYKARAQKIGGTGSCVIEAATTYPGTLLVEDIGPA